MKLSTALLLSFGLISTNVFADDSSTSMPSDFDMPKMTTESKCAKDDTKCMEEEAAAAKAAAEKSTTDNNATGSMTSK